MSTTTLNNEIIRKQPIVRFSFENLQLSMAQSLRTIPITETTNKTLSKRVILFNPMRNSAAVTPRLSAQEDAPESRPASAAQSVLHHSSQEDVSFLLHDDDEDEHGELDQSFEKGNNGEDE